MTLEGNKNAAEAASRLSNRLMSSNVTEQIHCVDCDRPLEEAVALHWGEYRICPKCELHRTLEEEKRNKII